MSHNASQQKRRQAILSGSLTEFSAWTMIVACGNCRHHRVFPLADLLSSHDGAMPVGTIVKRLRCSTPGCHAEPDHVVVSNRLHEVVLVGQGAF
jgi:hypothetical protein